MKADIEPVGEPGERHPNCLACGRFRDSQHPFLGIEPKRRRCDVVAVGQQPGYWEDRRNRNFCGASGDLLDGVAAESQLDAYRVGYVNAIRCYHDGEKVTDAQVKLCRPFLLADIARARPQVVVAMGAVAMKSLTSLANVRLRQGETIQSKHGFPVIPVYNPAAVLHDPRVRRDLLSGLCRVVDFLKARAGEPTRMDALRTRYRIIQTIPELHALADQLLAAKRLYFDTEFQPLDVLDPNFIVLSAQFARVPKEGFFIPVDHPESPFLGRTENLEVKRVLKHIIETVPLVPHDAEVDVAASERGLGVDIMKIRIAFDTFRASHCVFGKPAIHRLKHHAFTLADTGGYDHELEHWKKNNKMEHGYGDIPLQILAIPYGCADCDTCAQIERPLLKKLVRDDDLDQRTYYFKVLLPSWRLNWIMRRTGMLIDWDQWRWRWGHWTQQQHALDAAARANPLVAQFADEHEAVKKSNRFSLRSRPQRIALCQRMGLPFGTETRADGGPAFDKSAVLEMLSYVDNDPRLEPHRWFLELLQERAKVTTTLGTFSEGVARAMYPDGRIHPEHKVTTESGRRNTSNPNVQNWPVKDPSRPVYDGMAGPDDPWNFRMQIRAPDGCVIVGADYRQIEMRTAASYSGDETLLKSCREDDPHAAMQRWLVQIARKWERRTRQPLTVKLERKHAKTTNFQLIYGCAAPRLQEEIRKTTGTLLPEPFCEYVIEKNKSDLYPTLWRHIAKVHRQIARTGYVTTPVGHVRLFPYATDVQSDEYLIAQAQREGWNHQNQSIAHCILSRSMDVMQEYIHQHNKRWAIFLDLHDAFYQYVPEDEVDDCVTVIKWAMEEEAPQLVRDWLRVPTPCEISIGDHLGHMAAIGG